MIVIITIIFKLAQLWGNNISFQMWAYTLRDLADDGNVYILTSSMIHFQP